MRIRIIALGIFLLFTRATFSQQKNSVVVVAKSKKDGIWLRWAPADVATWQLANRVGYTIERFTLLPDGDLEPSSQRLLTPIPVKPYTKAEFEKLSQPSDEVLSIEELLYGDDFSSTLSTGNIASVVSKRRELENRFGISLLMCDVSQDAAKAAGLFFKDATIKAGQRYIYRIKPAETAVGLQVNPATIIVKVEDEKPLLVINDLKVTFNDHKATLGWSTILHKGIYTAYYIEKSTDGKNFKRMSELPYVHMSEKLESEKAFFVDSLDANGTTFYYRINGMTPFAETGPYSNVVSGQGKDNLAGFLIIREGKVLEQKKVRIAWEFPAVAEKQIEGFIVSSSNKPDGPFTDLTKKPLLKTVREFISETPYYNTYYTVRAVAKDGSEITRSFQYLVQIADETPPANPTGLTGTMSQSGIATLKWNDNTDKDLMGYRVFRSNSLHEEFVEVTREILPKPFFQDTVNIRVLNKKIYYQVVAMDKNYNPSNYSNLLKLMRPDVIPPAEPVFLKTEMTKDSIMLEWSNSVSDDIASYELVRIEKEERLNRVIKSWHQADLLTHYNDPGLILGRTYSYKIIAYDSAGNKSEGKSKEVFFETGVRKAITDVKVNVDRTIKQIQLQWMYATPSVKCMIYKQKNNGPLTLYKTMEGNVDSFTDKDIAINNQYSYKVQLVFPKGIKSLLTEEIKVMY